MNSNGDIKAPEKILTVSIAAYNVEKTIAECLDSFLPSRYLGELELLVIDDGGTDGTAEIVRGYEARYPGVIRLVHKENGGHGSTINKSLELATGRFYKVLDGDDWVDAAELDKLIERLHTTTADMVINRYNNVYPDHSVVKETRGAHELARVYKFSELTVPQPPYYEGLFAMHATTILTERLREVRTRITEKCFYADTEYILYAGLAARTVEFNNSCAYQYRLGSAGQSVSAEGVYRHVEDMFTIYWSMLSVFDTRVHGRVETEREQYIWGLIDSRYNMLFGWYTRYQRPDKDYLLASFIDELKRKYPEYVRNLHLATVNKPLTLAPVPLIRLQRYLRKTRLWSVLKAIKHLLSGKPPVS